MRRGLATLALLAPVVACVAPSPQDGAGGCWVNAFAREDYRPPVTTYTGPTHERFSLEGSKSLVVGPGARLMGYRGASLEAQSVVELAPGTSIARLAARDFHGRVDSFQVLCGPGTG